MSIMAHRVKVLPYKTFRLHVAVCPPYNADFDGDEMNLHIPQSEEAQTEARLLMQVQDQILSPRYGAPIIGATKDFISGAYLLTRKETLLTANEVGKLLSSTNYSGALPHPLTEKPKPMYSGKSVFSLFLPEDFNFVTRANICQHCPTCTLEDCEYDAYVMIKDGILRSGVIDKNSIGAERSATIFHRIIKDYGTDYGHDFLNSITKLINGYLMLTGFSYSLDELEISSRERLTIDKVMRRMENHIEGLIDEYNTGRLERLPGQTLQESFEIQVMNELAQARDQAGETVEQGLGMGNAGIIMTRSGARGSSLNIGQMMGTVGQQSIRGKRIMRGYEHRTLPHFDDDDPAPAARGFVYNCYRDGLTPIEFFFHAMGGREGLVDTAVRTQQSGYMQRRLINALEHLRVEYDGTVRNSIGDIIQFQYGGDGIDPAKSDHGKAVNITQLVDRAKIIDSGTSAPTSYISKKTDELKEILPPSMIEELKTILAKSDLSNSGVDGVIQSVLRNFDYSLVEPGEAVGIVAAQSIGEPGTQMTLRTFHYAGVAELNVTLGLPRLIEIVDARKSPSTPVMQISLDEKHKKSEDKAREIAQKLTYTVMDDVIDQVQVDLREEAVIFTVNTEKMNVLGVTLEDVSTSIPFKYEKKDDYTFIISLTEEKTGNPELLIEELIEASIKGIPEINRVLTTTENDEWVIRTDGSNLEGVLNINGIDPLQTTTNNIHEIAEILGIEAARNALVQEAHNVLEEQGLDVDLRHVMLVADIMTKTGDVQQIGRHGISGEKSSVLARAAFELTIQHLVNAALTGETDPLKGVIENIIVGQSMPIGTGSVELFMTMGEQEDE